jgi:hypothetical protein
VLEGLDRLRDGKDVKVIDEPPKAAS